MFLLVIGRLETRFEGYIFKLNGNPGRLPHRAFVCIQFPVDSYTDQAVRPSRFSSFDKWKIQCKLPPKTKAILPP